MTSPMLTRARAAPGHAQRCGAARSMRAPAIPRVAAAATLRLCLACLRCRAARRRGAQRVAVVPRGAFASPASRSPLSADPQNALRLHDNAALLAALTAAASSGGKVACVFVWSEAEEGTAGPECPRPGAASRVWLHAALASLDADLRRRFATPLLFAAAPHGATLRQLGAGVRASRVHAAERYEPALACCDQATAAELAAHGMHLALHPGSLLHPPGDVALELSGGAGHFGALPAVPTPCRVPRSRSAAANRHHVAVSARLRAPPAAAAAAARAERRRREALSGSAKPAAARLRCAGRAATGAHASPRGRQHGGLGRRGAALLGRRGGRVGGGGAVALRRVLRRRAAC